MRSAIVTVRIVLVTLFVQATTVDAAEVWLPGADEGAKTTRDQIESLQAKLAPALQSYADVKALLNDFMKLNKGPIDFAPHGAFWNEMTHKQFIEGDVPGVTDRTTGKPLKVLIVGNGKDSNIIMALRGAKGSIFERETGSTGQMPLHAPFHE